MEHASEYYEKAMADLKTTVDLKSFPTVIKLEEKLLTLATYNIRNTTDRYVERRACLLSTIVAAFKSHRFAALGLQEVRFEAVENDSCFMDQASDIVRALDEAALPNAGPFVILRAALLRPFVSTMDPLFRIDGNAIIVDSAQVAILDHTFKSLSDCRCIQRALLRSAELLLPNLAQEFLKKWKQVLRTNNFDIWQLSLFVCLFVSQMLPHGCHRVVRQHSPASCN